MDTTHLNTFGYIVKDTVKITRALLNIIILYDQ